MGKWKRLKYSKNAGQSYRAIVFVSTYRILGESHRRGCRGGYVSKYRIWTLPWWTASAKGDALWNQMIIHGWL